MLIDKHKKDIFQKNLGEEINEVVEWLDEQID